MTHNYTALRLSVFWVHWKYTMVMCLLSLYSTMNYLQNHVRHSLPPFSKYCNKTLLNSDIFYFTSENMLHTWRPYKINALLRFAKKNLILSTYFVDDYFKQITAVSWFVQLCMYQCLLQTLKWRRLTIYGESYSHKISAVDMFQSVQHCHAM
jgi:hypothetical protein